MLSNSNVFILLILIEYITLFDITLANTVPVNNNTRTIDKIQALSSNDTISVDTINKLTNVDHFMNETNVPSANQNADETKNFTQHKSFDGHFIETPTVNVTSLSSSSLSSAASIQTIQSTIDQAINTDEIPLLHDNNSKNVQNNTIKSNKRTEEMVSSTSASMETSSREKSKLSNNTSTSNATINVNKMQLEHVTTAQSSNKIENIMTINEIIHQHGNDKENHKIQNIKSQNYYDNVGNDHKNDDYYHLNKPQADAPITNFDHMNQLPEQAIRSDAVYFIVAVIGGAKIWSRTLARTLSDMGPPFSGDPLGSPLRPIYIDLPTNGRFSVNVLLSLCQQTEKRPLAGVVVIGNGQSAHAVALSGTSMNLPVLWARGGTTILRELHPEASLQALLQPSAIEVFEAIRALFLQTHWHSFFVLSNAQATNVMNAKDNPLKKAPLTPTVVPLPRNNDDVFKQLAQISRSTRGVILLLCNLQSTRRIMSEAQRLNMVGGHFIWLWIDTGISSGYFDQSNSPMPQPPIYRHQAKPQQQQTNATATTTTTATTNNNNNNNNNKKIMETSGNPAWKTDELNENRKGKVDAWKFETTQTKPIKIGQSEKNDKEIIKSVLEPSEILVNGGSGGGVGGGGVDVDAEKSDSSTKPNGDFSQPFDPFRVLQRQDDHLKFGSNQHYQDRNMSRDKQAPVNRLILGLRSETHAETVDQNNKKNRRSTTDDHHHLDDVDDGDDDDKLYDGSVGEMLEESGEEDDLSTLLYSNRNASSSSSSSSSSKAYSKKQPTPTINKTKQQFSDDNLFDYLIDNNNFNENRNSKINFKRTSNVSHLNNNNTSTTTSFVNYYQFKDFPVGLLALRPIRMNIDRHFIRAAVRVFAATWQKINFNDKQINKTGHQSSSSPSRNLTQNINRSMLQITRPTLRAQQDKARNRNAHISAPLYNAKKLDNELYNRIMRRKRNISTVNRLLLAQIEKRSIKLINNLNLTNNNNNNTSESDHVAHTTTKIQVNTSQLGNEMNRTSDKYNNILNERRPLHPKQMAMDVSMIKLNDSFSSDLPNKNNSKKMVTTATTATKLFNKLANHSDSSSASTKQVNVSFNQNLSGLWKQNSENKSNIQAFNFMQSQTTTTTTNPLLNKFYDDNDDDADDNDDDDGKSTETMIKEASQSIVTNWFDQNIRKPSIKRQSAWWSTKKENSPSTSTSTSTQQNKQRPITTADSTWGQQTRQQQQQHQHQQQPHQQGHFPNRTHSMEFSKKETPRYMGGCYGNPTKDDIRNAEYFSRALRDATKKAMSGKAIFNGFNERALTTNFELLNLVPTDHPYPLKMSNVNRPPFTIYQQLHRQKRATTNTKSIPPTENYSTKWRRVGLVTASSVRLDTIVWPGGDIVVSGLSARARSVFRIVTALAPPFVMESELDEDGLCLRGLPCHRVSPIGRHNLTLMFNAIETRDRLEEDAVEHGNDLPPEPEYLDEKISHVTKCCYGLTMDLLDNIAMELGFEFHLYVVRDQLFGSKQQRDVKDYLRNDKKQSNAQQKTFSKTGRNQKSQPQHQSDNVEVEQWNGIVGDLTGGSADMSFAPLSVSKARAQVIDFSIPYFHSGVSLLASPKTKSEIPLLAFLLPFSPELWIAIFTSLNITAVAVAVYEWLSPFGLNPWGRQRSKNFSLSSALWVMWGLLCGHLVAFKAPKSWPNKFLINVWGGFSVIFVASYTANIAALIAGLFFHHAASSYDSSLTTQRVGAPIASAAESYVQNKDQHLWEHMKKYSLDHIEDGIRGLKNGTLDLLMADSPILDYYRATDHGCSLQRIGETFVEDTYAIGMVKGFPLKESISALIAKYSSNGYLDILTEKWYGGLPCFKYEAEIVTPRPLGVAAVAGVFLLLGLGMLMGVIILIFEHWFYKYALPSLRLKPKGTIWKSRNIMFFSQKLYRFINCVELVSPHHAARELVHSIRQGQIASLFQKSIKRKEDEQRRRRKSKAQFFEMIQEIRRAQQVERQNLAAVAEAESQKENLKSPPLIFKPKASPKTGLFSALKKEGRSRSNSSALTVRRYSTDSILGDRMDSIGRRLSRDLTNSPPDLGRRYDAFNKNDVSPSRYETISAGKSSLLGISKSNETLTNRFDTYSGKTITEKSNLHIKLKKAIGKRPKISFDSYHRDKTDDQQSDKEDYELPSVKEGLEPSFLQDDRSAAILRHKLHKELREKYSVIPSKPGTKQPNATDVKPPLPRKVIKHQRQKSLDNLDIDQNMDGNQPKTSPYSSDSNAGSLTKMNQRSQMSLERLSREDLLRLSHSSQSEIHEYLKNSTMPDRSAEPP